jgi:hypothetical protein
MIRYDVTVCDVDPTLGGRLNKNTYKFASRRRAASFAEQSLSQGLFVLIHTEEVTPYRDLLRPEDCL